MVAPVNEKAKAIFPPALTTNPAAGTAWLL